MQCELRVQLCDVVVRNAQAEALGNCRGHQNTFSQGKTFSDTLPRPSAKGKIGKTVTITVVGWINRSGSNSRGWCQNSGSLWVMNGHKLIAALACTS